ncbi:MAG: permease prefix domain 1-containing protein [Lachnospiraceae bacterium]|nr:permease prefix domain 1-containing protein [Lachnospiraceae bacterium]MDY5520815.1 permease prefix domain 1-containing protein [Agathobacter sp.]
MEAIRNYLETMFLNLPNTPEVYKAKNELWQMMEDKYTELKAEGKSENEAVGTVISEFGNLDELAKDLGIEQIVHSTPVSNAKTLPLEDVKRYIAEHSKHAFFTALGVMLCILSVCAPILFDGIAGAWNMNEDAMSALGVCLMFVLIAIAVGLFIYSGVMIGKWKYLQNENYVTDFATTEYLHQQAESYKPTYAILLTIGVILCVLSVVPSILIDSFTNYSYFWENLSGALLFVFAGIGVFMIVIGSMRIGSYNTLLKLNQQGTVGGSYTTSQQNNSQYIHPAVTGIMSVYWPTVTCLYLIWSFLTFDWWITWIIWPIAGIIASLINNTLKK